MPFAGLLKLAKYYTFTYYYYRYCSRDGADTTSYTSHCPNSKGSLTHRPSSQGWAPGVLYTCVCVCVCVCVVVCLVFVFWRRVCVWWFGGVCVVTQDSFSSFLFYLL